MVFEDFIDKEVTLIGYIGEFDINNGSAIIVEFSYNNNIYIIKVCGDDDDGYRSHLSHIEMITNKDDDYKNGEFTSLPPAKVEIKHITYYSADGYELKDSLDYVWISFGVNNSDDYYPWYYLNICDINLKSWRYAQLNSIL